MPSEPAGSSNASDPTRESAGDVAHAIVRSALNAIPVGGGAAVELFNALVTPPIERRRRAWIASVGEALTDLQRNVGTVDVKCLAEDEEFVTLLVSATQLAIRTHREEKLDGLRNAVLNFARGDRPSEDLQAAFLALVDRFTPLHLRLLRIFSEGFVWSNEGYPVPKDLDLPPMLIPSIGSYGDLLELDRTLLSLVLRDLVSTELIQHWIIDAVTSTRDEGPFKCTVKQWGGRSASEMHVKHGPAILVHRKPGSYVTRTTHLAGQFVHFISQRSFEG